MKFKTFYFLIVLLSFAFCLFPFGKAYAASWYDENWSYRKEHLINNATGAGTNYQVGIKVYYGSGTDGTETVDNVSMGKIYCGGNCKTDFGDIRFTSSNGTTLLNYWIETKTDSNNAIIWVKITDSLESTNQTIYIYYGKGDATTTSNATNTLLWYDDFNRASLGSNYTIDGGSWSIVSNELQQATLTNYYQLYVTSLSSLTNYEIRYKWKTNTGSNTDSGGVVRAASTNVGLYLERRAAGGYLMRNADTEIVNVPMSGPETGWHNHQIQVWSTNRYRFYEDGTNYIDYTGALTLTSGSPGLATYQTATPFHFDDFIVRKYIYPEPTHDSWGAEETSSNYSLFASGFGAGGTASSSSQHYMLQGTLGEIETASLSSTNFRLGPGLTYMLEPNVPPAPTLTNPSNYYNKLKIVIGTGGNPTDTTYAIAVSTDSFVSNINYVQADNTLGSNIFFQDYASWGGASPGTTIIGLTPGVTYYAKVAARRGTFQQGAFSAIASAATVNPTLTFSLITTSQAVPPFSVAIGNLTAGNVTTSPDKVTATITTNATSGGLVYLNGINNGLKSTTAGNYNISSVSNNLTSISEGYGARGTTVTQSSGGPMELVAPYNGASNNVGIIDTAKRTLADSTSAPVTNGQVSFELKAKASNITPSATDYTDTLTVIATGSF